MPAGGSHHLVKRLVFENLGVRDNIQADARCQSNGTVVMSEEQALESRVDSMVRLEAYRETLANVTNLAQDLAFDENAHASFEKDPPNFSHTDSEYLESGALEIFARKMVENGNQIVKDVKEAPWAKPARELRALEEEVEEKKTALSARKRTCEDVYRNIDSVIKRLAPLLEELQGQSTRPALEECEKLTADWESAASGEQDSNMADMDVCDESILTEEESMWHEKISQQEEKIMSLRRQEQDLELKDVHLQRVLSDKHAGTGRRQKQRIAGGAMEREEEPQETATEESRAQLEHILGLVRAAGGLSLIDSAAEELVLQMCTHFGRPDTPATKHIVTLRLDHRNMVVSASLSPNDVPIADLFEGPGGLAPPPGGILETSASALSAPAQPSPAPLRWLLSAFLGELRHRVMVYKEREAAVARVRGVVRCKLEQAGVTGIVATWPSGATARFEASHSWPVAASGLVVKSLYVPDKSMGVISEGTLENLSCQINGKDMAARSNLQGMVAAVEAGLAKLAFSGRR